MEKLEALFEDQAFVEKVTACGSIEEITALLNENGVEISADEVKDLLADALASTKSGELSSEDLENVTGGRFKFKFKNPFKALGEKLGTGLGNYWENLINSHLN